MDSCKNLNIYFNNCWHLSAFHTNDWYGRQIQVFNFIANCKKYQSLELEKKDYLFAVQEESKIFILFLRNEENEKGEEESSHEEKSGNTIFLNC